MSGGLGGRLGTGISLCCVGKGLLNAILENESECIMPHIQQCDTHV